MYPSPETDLLASGLLARLVQAVRGRRVSAVELVETPLARIDRARELNAVVALRADVALEEARAIDEGIAHGNKTGSLAGLPLLVKDVEDVAGMPTTFGSLLRRDSPPATAGGRRDRGRQDEHTRVR